MYYLLDQGKRRYSVLRLFCLSLIITVAAFGQPVKPSVTSVQVEETRDTARYYYYYSPRLEHQYWDYEKWDLWITFVIDSSFFPGTERFPDGTYKRWKRAPDGKLLPLVRITPRSEEMRQLMLSDTATFTPHWRGEIPR